MNTGTLMSQWSVSQTHTYNTLRRNDVMSEHMVPVRLALLKRKNNMKRTVSSSNKSFICLSACQLTYIITLKTRLHGEFSINNSQYCCSHVSPWAQWESAGDLIWHFSFLVIWCSTSDRRRSSQPLTGESRAFRWCEERYPNIKLCTFRFTSVVTAPIR